MEHALAGWPWVVAAYLIGSIPIGVLVAKAHGVDLRRVGSGNIGATNAVRALGRGWGTFVFVLDAAKGFAPARACMLRGDDDGTGVLCAMVGVATVLGHVVSIFLGFRGGKGVSCAFGTFLALDPVHALSALVVYGVTLAWTRISGVGSLLATATFGVLVLVSDRPPPLRIAAWVVVGLIVLRHRRNIAVWIRSRR